MKSATAPVQVEAASVVREQCLQRLRLVFRKIDEATVAELRDRETRQVARVESGLVTAEHSALAHVVLDDLHAQGRVVHEMTRPLDALLELRALLALRVKLREDHERRAEGVLRLLEERHHVEQRRRLRYGRVGGVARGDEVEDHEVETLASLFKIGKDLPDTNLGGCLSGDRLVVEDFAWLIGLIFLVGGMVYGLLLYGDNEPMWQWLLAPVLFAIPAWGMAYRTLIEGGRAHRRASRRLALATYSAAS